MNRREFITKGLGFVAVGAAGILLPDLAAASDRNFWYRDRWVEIRRAQTGERMKITFFEGGRYVPEAYQQLCYMMRDVVDRGRTSSIDFGVFNLMYGIQGWARDAGVANPLITVNSGYRTRAHNNNLEGAAKNSLHVHGMAADISVRGLNPDQVGQMARYYKIGGVGFYDGFTHIDTGRVRQWRGGG